MVRMMISILAIAKTKIAKIGPTKAIFKPPATIFGVSCPAASMVSNALINPIVRPRNPQAKANHAIEDISLMFFSLSPFAINSFTKVLQ